MRRLTAPLTAVHHGHMVAAPLEHDVSDSVHDDVPSQLRRIDGERRGELASFLRSRRARLRPDDVGLPTGRRRRTPGLRREEVAQLAGVGVTWYTWLEQGRPIRTSGSVLDAIARTLGLDAAERAHLHRLAGIVAPHPPEMSDDVPDSVHAIMRALDPLPATLINARYDLLAWNRSHDAFFHDWHTIPCAHRNLLWCCFTEPKVRERYVNFEVDAPLMVANLRSAFARHLGDPAWSEFIGRLQDTSSYFAELWARHDVGGTVSRLKHLHHPVIGEVWLRSNSMVLSEMPGTPMLVYTPEDELSRARLVSLSSST